VRWIHRLSMPLLGDSLEAPGSASFGWLHLWGRELAGPNFAGITKGRCLSLAHSASKSRGHWASIFVKCNGLRAWFEEPTKLRP